MSAEWFASLGQADHWPGGRSDFIVMPDLFRHPSIRSRIRVGIDDPRTKSGVTMGLMLACPTVLARLSSRLRVFA